MNHIIVQAARGCPQEGVLSPLLRSLVVDCAPQINKPGDYVRRLRGSRGDRGLRQAGLMPLYAISYRELSQRSRAGAMQSV